MNLVLDLNEIWIGFNFMLLDFNCICFLTKIFIGLRTILNGYRMGRYLRFYFGFM